MKLKIFLFLAALSSRSFVIACDDGNLIREKEIYAHGFSAAHFYFQMSVCGKPQPEIFSVKLESKGNLRMEASALTSMPASLKTDLRVSRGASLFQFTHGLRVAGDAVVTGASLKRINAKSTNTETELVLIPEKKIFNRPVLPSPPPSYAPWKFPSWMLKEKGDSDLSRTVHALRRRIYPAVYDRNSNQFRLPATSDVSGVLFRSPYFRGQIQSLLDGMNRNASSLEWHDGQGRLGGDGRISGEVPEELFLEAPERIWLYGRGKTQSAKRHASSVAATLFINAPPNGSFVSEGTASIIYQPSEHNDETTALFAIGTDSEYRLSPLLTRYEKDPATVIRNPLLPLVDLTKHIPVKSYSNSDLSVRFLETESKEGEARFFVWDGDRNIVEINELVKEAFWDNLVSWDINDGRYVLILATAGSEKDRGDVLWVLDRKNWALTKIGALTWQTLVNQP